MQKNLWIERKRKFWLRLWEDLEIGYLDKDLLPLLVVLNTEEKIYTMSSCSGRISASDSETPWSRSLDSTVIFKKHTPMVLEEVLKLYEIPVYRRIWLNVTGPIIHLSTADLATAVKVLRIARASGYKHSGILSISRSKGVIVELTTGIYLSLLLRTRDTDIVKQSELSRVTQLVNETLYEGKKKLSRLYVELKRILPWSPDEYVVRYLEEKRIRIHERDPIDVFEELSKSI